MVRFLLFLFLLLAAGCGTVNRATAPWTPLVKEGPLCGPDEIAVLESREYWSSIMAAGVSGDYRFRTPDGRTTDATRLSVKIISFLARQGHLARWPDSRSSIGGTVQKLAPYKIYLISVLPAIVVLAPHDYGDISENRSNVDIVGWPPKESLGDSRILNHIFFGCRIPKSEPLLWFSPDLGVDITPLQKSIASEFVIDTPRIKMVGRSDGTALKFERK